MGTLTNFMGSDEDTIAKSFKPASKSTLEAGGADILGVPVGPPLPTPALASSQALVIEDVDDLGIFSKAYGQTIMAIDKALPPGILSPPIFDPTFVIPIEPFFTFLIELGIEDPLEWFKENYSKVLSIDPAAITDMAQCKNEKFAEEMNKIDPSIEVGKAQEAAQEICGFAMPSFALPIFSFEMPDFGLPSLSPIEMFAIPNIEVPQINWAINFTLLEIVNLIGQLLAKIAQLLAAILEGIIAFIMFIVEFILEALLAILLAILAPLLQGILFVANLITFIVKVIAAFIVALIGHIIGDGLVTVLVADTLGLA